MTQMGMDELTVELVDCESLTLYPENPRQGDIGAIVESLQVHGQYQPLVVNRRNREVLAGNHRLLAARALDWEQIAVVWVDADEERARRIVLADNRTSDLASYNDELLAELLADLASRPAGLVGTGYSGDDLDELLRDLSGPLDLEAEQREALAREARRTLAERFLLPPFSVLDARRGWWARRKKAWKNLGIQSEIGRPANTIQGWTEIAGDAGYYDKKRKAEAEVGRELTRAEFLADHYEAGSSHSGTSIFDPVLSELLIRWFCPPGGRILDPFAGGSVRGIVSGMLGRSYLGVDLSGEQVRANQAQAAVIFGAEPAPYTDPTDLTPWQEEDGIWIKRDDLFGFGTTRGGKVRACLAIAARAEKGLVTAGAADSPQVNIVAQVAAHLGLSSRCHVPARKELTPELAAARAAGAELIGHRPGRNSVILARCREDIEALPEGWEEVPFGMECPEAVHQTRQQVELLPEHINRLVVPVGSGMSLAGILWGLRDAGRPELPVHAITVGADPTARLDKWAPEGWRDQVTITPHPSGYQEPARRTQFWGIELDAHYEAKAAEFVEPGDGFWIVGIRQTQLAGSTVVPRWQEGDGTRVGDLDERFDFILTCPPYFDLEVYSDDPRDLSMAPSYDKHLEAITETLRGCAQQLHPDRFATWVISDVREKNPRGVYQALVADTIKAAQAAGLDLYNEAILVEPAGYWINRIGRIFPASRKLARTHQHALVFLKGDPRAATAACGHLDVSFEADEWIGADDGEDQTDT